MNVCKSIMYKFEKCKLRICKHGDTQTLYRPQGARAARSQQGDAGGLRRAHRHLDQLSQPDREQPAPGFGLRAAGARRKIPDRHRRALARRRRPAAVGADRGAERSAVRELRAQPAGTQAGDPERAGLCPRADLGAPGLSPQQRAARQPRRHARQERRPDRADALRGGARLLPFRRQLHPRPRHRRRAAGRRTAHRRPRQLCGTRRTSRNPPWRAHRPRRRQ